MIIRALRLRRGRLALPRSGTPASRRWESSVQNNSTSDRVSAPAFSDSAISVAQQQLNSIPSVRGVTIHDPTHPVALDYAFFQHQKAITQHLGSAQTPFYRPHELLTRPPEPKDITLELLLASQAHIGHSTSLWHPANARYIFGVRGKTKDGESPIHIISLEATAAHLRRACKVVSGVAERGGLILFVGTREGQARAVVKAASLAGGCHLFTKWIPGGITNGQKILGKCAKKVVNEFDEDVPGFEDQLGDKSVLKPDLVVCLNPLENYVLLHECGLHNIPTIGVIDTNANPTWVTYPIPANDDSLRCVQVIAGVLGNAGAEGQRERLRLARDNVVTYSQAHGLEPPRQTETKSKKERRQPRLRPQPTVPAAAQEPDIPSDLAGVEVKQYEADQKLLERAEQTYVQGHTLAAAMTGAAATPDSAQASSTQQVYEDRDEVEEEEEKEEAALRLEEDYFSDTAAYDVYSPNSGIDPSLVDKDYSGGGGDSSTPSSSSVTDADDLNQFGGIDQLSSSSPSPSPPDEISSVEHELGEQPDSSSPLNQISSVEKELGEEPDQHLPDADQNLPTNPNREMSEEQGEKKI